MIEFGRGDGAKMSWQPEIDDLERRRELARRMGGPEGIERQHSQGKLTVRERIDRLADAGSFREFMGLADRAVYEDGRLSDFTPKPLVEGFCQIDGRKVVVTGGDFTVRGGSGGAGGGLGSETPSNRRALEWKLPYVRLLHAAGGSVRSFEEIGRTYLPDGECVVGGRRSAHADGARRFGGHGLGGGAAGRQRLPGALESDGEGNERAVSGRAAGGEGGAWGRGNEGRAGRRADARAPERSHRQPRG